MCHPRQTKSIQPKRPTILWGYVHHRSQAFFIGQQYFSIKIQIYEQQQTSHPEQDINTSLELVQRLAASFWELIPQIFAVVMLWGHTSQGQFQSRVLQQATTKILGKQIVELFNSLLPHPKILCWKKTKVKFLWLNYYYYYYCYYLRKDWDLDELPKGNVWTSDMNLEMVLEKMIGTDKNCNRYKPSHIFRAWNCQAPVWTLDPYSKNFAFVNQLSICQPPNTTW
jgi:hypothetical protein